MFAVVDIETTGPLFPKGRIMEIAIVMHDGFEIVDTFVTLINSGASIQPFVSKLTGINQEMLADAPSFFDVAATISQLTKEAIFVAHNVQFDYSFIQKEFKQLGFVFERKRYCTLQNAKRLIPSLPSYKLNKLCESLSIPFENHHRAQFDATATAALFELLLAEERKQQQLSKAKFNPLEMAFKGLLEK